MGEAIRERDENADNPIERGADASKKSASEMTWICVMGTRKPDEDSLAFPQELYHRF
jgi:hypothetical protein